MPTISGIPASSSHSSRLDHSLVFQFILSRFFLVRSEIINIKQLTDSFSEKNPTNLQDMSKIISRLVGASQIEVRIFDWSGDGILTKLKENCTQFAIQALKKNKDITALSKFVSALWHITVKTQDLTLKHMSPYRQHHTRSDLLRLSGKMSALLKEISGIIPKLLHLFKENENVIFYVLRNMDDFAALCGNESLAKLFDEMFPEGAEQAKNMLIEKYSKRGFSQLIPAINNKIDELISYRPLCPQ